jgi:hypothetical protein
MTVSRRLEPFPAKTKFHGRVRSIPWRILSYITL